MFLQLDPSFGFYGAKEVEPGSENNFSCHLLLRMRDRKTFICSMRGTKRHASRLHVMALIAGWWRKTAGADTGLQNLRAADRNVMFGRGVKREGFFEPVTAHAGRTFQLRSRR